MTTIAFLCVTSLAHSSEDEEKPAFNSQRTVSTNFYADRSLFAQQSQALTELPLCLGRKGCQAIESSPKAGPGCCNRAAAAAAGSSVENGCSAGIPAGSVTGIPSLTAIRVLGK